jgi:hypothetical protein
MTKKKKTPMVRILGVEYQLIFADGLGVDEEGTTGGIIEDNTKNPRIVVDTTQSGAVQRETLLHELLHASDRASGGGKELPEKVIDRLARMLYAIGRDNLSTMFWVFGGEDE